MDLKEINNYINYLTKLRSSKFGASSSKRARSSDSDSDLEEGELVLPPVPLFNVDSTFTPAHSIPVLPTPVRSGTAKAVSYTPTTSGNVAHPIKVGEYSICDTMIGVYYYTSSKATSVKVTPLKKNVIQKQSFEGEYHLNCKVMDPGYEMYNINENGVLFTNSKNSIDTIIDVDSIELTDKKIDYKLLIAFVLCQYLSLRCRIESTINRIQRNKEVDTGHVKAIDIKLRHITESMKYFRPLIRNYCNLEEVIHQNIGSVTIFDNIYNSIWPDYIHTPPEVTEIMYYYKMLPPLRFNMCTGKPLVVEEPKRLIGMTPKTLIF